MCVCHRVIVLIFLLDGQLPILGLRALDRHAGHSEHGNSLLRHGRLPALLDLPIAGGLLLLRWKTAHGHAAKHARHAHAAAHLGHAFAQFQFAPGLGVHLVFFFFVLFFLLVCNILLIANVWFLCGSCRSSRGERRLVADGSLLVALDTGRVALVLGLAGTRLVGVVGVAVKLALTV